MIVELYAEGTGIITTKRIYPLIEIEFLDKIGSVTVKLTKKQLEALTEQIKEASEQWEVLQKEAYRK